MIGKRGLKPMRKEEVEEEEELTTLKAGPHDYAIEFGPVDSRDWGRVDTDSQRFKIDDSGSASQVATAMLHELHHLVAKENALFDNGEEEKIVSVLAYGIAGLWRDNPKVFEFIREGLVDG
jgi:hypothetical protein